MKRLETLLSSVAALTLFAMMLLTTVDVFSRKFLGNSVTGTVELTELLMLTMIFFALPLASLASEHIVFDLLDRTLPASVVRGQRVLSHVIMTFILAGAAWTVWGRASRTLEYGDTTATLEIGLGPFHAMVAVLLAMTALLHLLLAVRETGRTGSEGGAA